MKIYLVFVILLIVNGVSSAQCSSVQRSHARLQWSEATKLVSPDRVWELEVRPLLTSDENQSPVRLHSCQGTGSRTLLTLQRSAEAYWGPDSKSLLIINEPVANSNKLLLFRTTSAKGSVEDAFGQIDDAVKRRLSQELGEKRHIEFYLPQFVSWKVSGLVLAVGGATSSGADGPMSPYCYGFLIDPGSREVRGVLSEERLKVKFGKECRVSP
jgi:hypothetical protein